VLASLLCTQQTTFTYVSIFSRHFLSRSLFSLVVTPCCPTVAVIIIFRAILQLGDMLERCL
jgi:hypothetical protein